MKLDFTFRVFAIVALVSAVALVVFLANSNTLAGQVVSQPPLLTVQELINSAALRVAIGGFIGDRISAFQGASPFAALAAYLMQTNEGRTTVEQSLVLKGLDFNGGRIAFAEDESGETGLFLIFDNNQVMWETQLYFSSGLNGEIESDGDIEDYIGEIIRIHDVAYTIIGAEMRGTVLVLKLAGPAGIVQLKDDITDNEFSSYGMDIGGQSVPADVNLFGTATSDKINLVSIRIRPRAQALQGGNVYVPEGQCTGNVMRHTGMRFSKDFDICNAGQKQVGTAQPTARRTTSVSGGLFELKGSRKQYTLFLGSTRLDLFALRSGSIFLGSDDTDLINSESTAIDLHDRFIVNPTGFDNPGDDWYLYEFTNHDPSTQTIYYRDLLSGSTKEARYTGTEGVLNIGGKQLKFEVVGTAIKVDLNGDGSIGGDTTVIIVSPAIYLEPSGGGGSADLDVVFRGRFREEKSANDVTTITAFKSGSEFDAMIDCDLQDVSGSIEQCMKDTGLLFTIDESRRPPRIIAGGSTSSVQYTSSGTSGEAQAYVVITFEKSKLLERSQ